MDGNVLIWILAIMVIISLGFSVAAFFLQLKRKNKMDKHLDATSKRQAEHESVNEPILQSGYSHQSVQTIQPHQVNSFFIDDDYKEKTQSLWDSQNMLPNNNAYAASIQENNCYKLYFSESGCQGLKNHEMDITGELTIGRAGTSAVVITDKTVSGLQCILSANPDGLYIENKSSSNITQLNGAAISGATLINPRDVIKMGKVELTILDIKKAV